MLSRLVSLSLTTQRSSVSVRRLQWMSSNSGNSAGPSTYYDSQSGQHVPIHDENKVTAYLRCRWNHTQQSAPLSTMINDAQTSLGAAGMIMARPNDSEGLVQQKLVESLGASLKNNTLMPIDKEFTIFLHHNGKLKLDDVSHRNDVNICFEYTNESNIENDLVETHDATNGRTSIAIADPIYYNEEDPVLVAARIASLIDNTSGGAYILLSPTDGGDGDVVGDDEMVQLCEELSYLDVVGPTIKSRLVVAALSDDQVEECLGIGISKYIIEDELGLRRLRDVVEEQGKELIIGQ